MAPTPHSRPGYYTPFPAEAFCIKPTLIKMTDDPSHALYLPDRPLPGSAQEAAELQELIDLQQLRNDAGALACSQAGRERHSSSQFLSDVQTGYELGMRFADETPEAIYRTVLNQIFTEADWSLEAKAQLRMCLDAAMYNARLISWHYKWRSSRGLSVTFRPRPTEIAPEINVLYHADSPSYPSAHSTIAGAASHLLSQCFTHPHHRLQFDVLANNIGMSCLWAGVNYRSDHVNGLRLGQAVSAVLLGQMGKA
ncbi:MAG: phosphatase PAP2 family protein [Anaerolineae bacterium]|nr:phosphatase PAP2 family protein [Anaerolineae bacterium]